MFIVSAMQYITCCLALSTSKPFRKPIHTNKLFLGSVIVTLVYQGYLILFLDDWNADLFRLVFLPKWFRYELAGIVIANSLCSTVFEKCV